MRRYVAQFQNGTLSGTRYTYGRRSMLLPLGRLLGAAEEARPVAASGIPNSDPEFTLLSAILAEPPGMAPYTSHSIVPRRALVTAIPTSPVLEVASASLVASGLTLRTNGP